MCHQLKDTYQVQRVGSITAVDPAEWKGIAGGDITVSYEWLRVTEACSPVGCRTEYILLRARKQLVGAGICQAEAGGGEVRNIDAYMFGRLKRPAAALGISFAPTLFGNNREGYGNVLVAPSVTGGARLTIMRRLIDVIETRAWEQGMRVCFDRVPEEHKLLTHVLEEKGYSRTIDLPAAVMDIQWNSLEGYVGHLRRTRGNTKVARHEIIRNRKAGVTIYPLQSIGNHQDRLHQLLVDNREKYEHGGHRFSVDFLTRTKSVLGENAVIYVAEKRGRLIGVSLMLIGNGTGYVLSVGVDHATAGNDFTYFNITYYRPASDAFSLGLKRLYFGSCHYDLKARRGCRITQNFMYYKSPQWIGNMAVKPFVKVHSAWYRSKLPQVAQGKGQAG